MGRSSSAARLCFRITVSAMAASEPAGTGAASGSGRFWLKAYNDRVAGVHACSACISLSNVFADNEYRLVVADAKQFKMKMWKSTSLESEAKLVDKPVAVISYQGDAAKGARLPTIAVAAGPHLYVYRSFRPYYKFTVPDIALSADERAVWSNLVGAKISVDEACNVLAALRDKRTFLSHRSKTMLSLAFDGNAPREQIDGFVAGCLDRPLVEQTVITCVATLRKNEDDDFSESVIVIGTENAKLHIVEAAKAFQTTHTENLPSTPVHVVAWGSASMDSYIALAMRNGQICVLKNKKCEPERINPGAHAVALAVNSGRLVVGLMGKQVHCYSPQGQRLHTIYLPASILCMDVLATMKKGQESPVIVALANAEIRVYNRTALLSVSRLREAPLGMRFGRYGREAGTLVTITQSGAVDIRILARTANLEGSTEDARRTMTDQAPPIKIPKKTVVYVEQTKREREKAEDIHRSFQRDLCKLRLSTARAYVKSISAGQGPTWSASGSSVLINASVFGLGPKFRLDFTLDNNGVKPIFGLTSTIILGTDVLRVDQSTFVAPLLLPSVQYTFSTGLRCVRRSETQVAVKILVSKSDSCVPILSGECRDPPAQPPSVPFAMFLARRKAHTHLRVRSHSAPIPLRCAGCEQPS